MGTPIAYAAPLVSEQALLRAPLATSTIAAAIEHEFGQDSIMVHIAWCESRLRQFGEDGLVLQGDVDPDDTGAFQINKWFHLKTAQGLGINVDTLPGNIAYARYLYDKNGTWDWRWSRHCWGKYVHK